MKTNALWALLNNALAGTSMHSIKRKIVEYMVAESGSYIPPTFVTIQVKSFAG